MRLLYREARLLSPCLVVAARCCLDSLVSLTSFSSRTRPIERSLPAPAAKQTGGLAMTLRTAWLLAWLISAPALAGQNVVVVLDDSGSMRDNMRSGRIRKIDAAKEALLTLLEKLPGDARLGIVVLNRGPDGWIVPLGLVRQRGLRGQIGQIRADGGTPLGEFMKIGADSLLELREQQRYGTYKLLIVTDGEANDEELVGRYLPDILSRGIVVDVIGVDMDQNHSLATAVHTYRSADDPVSLQQAVADVVLGESTADASDAGESDFVLLAGLPDEVAVAALEALAEPGNQPIGENPAVDAAIASGSIDVTLPTQQRGGGSFVSMLSACCGVGCLGAGVAFAIVFFIASRLSGPRR